jgi:hypothetical protein
MMKELAASEVRPDSVVCCASVTSLMLCRLHSEQPKQPSSSRSGRRIRCVAGTPPRAEEGCITGRRRCVRTLWSAVQVCLCSDALQELRRAQERDALWGANQVQFEKYREEEGKRRQEQKRAEVRPDFTSGLLCECD